MLLASSTLTNVLAGVASVIAAASLTIAASTLAAALRRGWVVRMVLATDVAPTSVQAIPSVRPRDGWPFRLKARPSCWS
jgi:hypothetical protein